MMQSLQQNYSWLLFSATLLILGSSATAGCGGTQQVAQQRQEPQQQRAQEARAGERPPNVVFILADDLGWSDTGVYGSSYYKTPHIDALAERGLLFTQAYAANALCSPTRASILTGQWPSRIGMTAPAAHLPQVRMEAALRNKAAPTEKVVPARSATRFDTTHYTLTEAFKSAGYATGHFGKWHLGRKPYDALHQGFDVAIPNSPAPGPAGGFLAPWNVWPDHGEPGEHIEDRMAEEASDFIRENSDRSFFLNYWAWSVHPPWEGKPELIEKWAERASPYELQHNPVYAAMVESFDDAVGTLMQTLEEEGVADNTMVIFTSDNGGWIWPILQVTNPPEKYANVPVTNSVPLRGGKATIYEGGTRVPLVAVWPGQIEPGVTNHTDIVQSIDFYPTLAELCGLQTRQAEPFDGISIAPALYGESLDRETIFSHFPNRTPATGGFPSVYVRRADWKLIRFYADNPDQTDRLELYNLRKDIGETVNVASDYPERVRELNSLIDRFLEESDSVVPKPNPAYDPAR